MTVIKLRVDADKKQESLPLYIAFIIYNGNIRFSIFEMSAERTPDILSFYSSKIPCLGIEQQKFLRSDRTSVAPCGEHVARNQVSLFCDLFHRRMTDDLEQLSRSVHFCSVNLRPYPYRRIFIPHLSWPRLLILSTTPSTLFSEYTAAYFSAKFF